MPTMHLASLFHLAACDALSIDPAAHGAKSKVAKLLGEDLPNYSRRVAGGRTSEAVLIRWVNALEDNSGAKIELRFHQTVDAHNQALPVPTPEPVPSGFAELKVKPPGRPQPGLDPGM